MKRPFSISAYTTTFNCVEMEYPFEQCIESLLGFADEVAVADAGSTDGTLEVLERIQKRESRFKFSVEPVDFKHPRWAIHQDGYLKAKARKLCTGDYCWQTDTDEIVPTEDFAKINSLPQVAAGHPLIMLPMVEFWGSFDWIRGDFFSWKPRFSVNDPRITHGIPHRLRMYDAAGHEYPRPYDSDSCNYIYADTLQDVPIHVPFALTEQEQNELQREPIETARKAFFRALDMYPSVLHVSWLDFPRKIRHYKRFWHGFHASMYNTSIADTAETNAMFDKPWSQVTETEIAEKSAQLKQIGPRSFHKKIDPNVTGIIFPFNRPIPETLRRWAEETAKPPARSISVSSSPLVSAIIPSYNKAPFLRQSIGSIAEQDYPNIEIVVVNDGSPDNTNELVQQLIRERPQRNIRLLEKQNGGISDARNFGIAHSTGSLLLFLDGDDIAKQGFVSAAVERHTNHGNNLICTNVELFGSSTGEWLPPAFDLEGIRYESSIPTLTVLEKSLWEKAGGFNVCFPFVEDWNFWVAVSRFQPSVHRLPGTYYLYRTSDDGLAHLFTDSHYECLALVMTAQNDLYPAKEVLWGHSLFRQMRPSWLERFEKQDRIHPTQWLLKLWLGLFAEARGDNATAEMFYIQSSELAPGNDWQACVRLALVKKALGKEAEIAPLIQRAGEQRPDLLEVLFPNTTENSGATERA